MAKRRPKLRNVQKSESLFPLNHFPQDFPLQLGKELIYLLATKSKPSLEGAEWEEIFANCIGADWKPSNVGLDDVVLGDTAWGAKTVKAKKPFNQQRVRLISGRNSLRYSYGETIDPSTDPNFVGEMVLSIWNERVSAVREKFRNLRMVVLLKSDDLSEVVVFEFDTIRYDPELFSWKWNKNNNLEGANKEDQQHCFTWQPHGSQFTIIEQVPDKKLVVRVKTPKSLEKEQVLGALGFDPSWISIERIGT